MMEKESGLNRTLDQALPTPESFLSQWKFMRDRSGHEVFLKTSCPKILTVFLTGDGFFFMTEE